MKKKRVMTKNLSLRLNTKTKTNIKTLIHPAHNSSNPTQSQRLERAPYRKIVECQRPTLKSLGSGYFFNQLTLRR